MTDGELEASFRPAARDPYEADDNTLHAGKVFVIPQSVLTAAAAIASDGTAPREIGDRLLLCLWDVVDGRSIWLELQSNGENSIPHEAKYLTRGLDPNWMNPEKISYYRNGTIWCLGRPGTAFTYRQAEQRGVRIAELENIRARISPDSIKRLLAE